MSPPPDSSSYLGLAPALPALPCHPAAGNGMEVLPILGTGPCPRLLGVGKQGAALSSTLGRGPSVPAWAEGQLSPEITEPGPVPHLMSPREGYIKGSFREEM